MVSFFNMDTLLMTGSIRFSAWPVVLRGQSNKKRAKPKVVCLVILYPLQPVVLKADG
jgi:hypothetical protein